MRTIDADALKKVLCEKYEAREYYIGEKLLEAIDNAPTIKTFTLADIEEQYLKGLEKGLSEWEAERPEGKWIIDGHHIRCSRCNEYICNTDREGNKISDNFCPNCGADMRGGKE